MKHLEHTLETYMNSHYNMCNILIYLTSIRNAFIPLKHLKHMFATCAFSVTSPCYLGMEARRCVEFNVEAAGGTELAAPVEKAATGSVEKAAMDLARAVTASVKKVVCVLEKAAADAKRDRDGGRRVAVADWRRGGDGERRAVALGRGGDAGR
jgi:hypothetical protein